MTRASSKTTCCPLFGSRRVGQIARPRDPAIGGQLVEVLHAIDGDADVRRPARCTDFRRHSRPHCPFAVCGRQASQIHACRATGPVPSATQVLASELGPDQAAMMWLGVVGGLRWAECAGLQVRALDLLNGTVSVSAQLGRDGRLAAPKSRAGTRRLSLPGWLVNDLAAVLARRGLTAANPEEFVFVSPEGMPLNYTNWRRTWQIGLQKGRASRSSLSRPSLYGCHCTRRRWCRHKDGPGSLRPFVPSGYARHICEGDRAGRQISCGGHRGAIRSVQGQSVSAGLLDPTVRTFRFQSPKLIR